MVAPHQSAQVVLINTLVVAIVYRRRQLTKDTSPHLLSPLRYLYAAPLHFSNPPFQNEQPPPSIPSLDVVPPPETYHSRTLTESILYTMATFFDKIKRDFKDVPVDADNKIATAEFLEASESLVTLFGM